MDLLKALAWLFHYHRTCDRLLPPAKKDFSALVPDGRNCRVQYFKASVWEALLFTSSLATAAPALDAFQAKIEQGLRLIKTSEADPGLWVTEEEKMVNYTGKRVHFIDITDIEDLRVLQILSGAYTDSLRISAIDYTAVSHRTEANRYIGQLSTTGPQSWLHTLSNFYNRFFMSSYGTQSSAWLYNQTTSLVSPNPNITVTKFKHSYNQPSIIVRIPGFNPNLIIVGAHYDSFGGNTTARGPGADDNGSGVVVLMECLRVLAKSTYAPNNTMEFHFYSGEEGGLLGSADVWKSYKAAAKKVLAFVNTDMAGYLPSGMISTNDDYVDTGLTDPQDAYDTVNFTTVLRHAKFIMAFLIEANYLQAS
ncbi:MAG: hypothetical protein Q9218_005945 [Villophora microphyllina]